MQKVLLEDAFAWAVGVLQRTDSDAFLVGFNDQIITSTELGTDVARLRGAADQLRPFGGSAIRDAIVHTQKFSSLPPQSKQEVRIILLLSDGFDNASVADERRAIEAAQRAGVRVYALSFPSAGAAAGERLLKDVTQRTGGTVFFPATDAEGATALAAINRDIANSFAVTFIPRNHDGRFHRLNFAVQGEKDSALRFAQEFVATQ
jgi:hypothetical protein